MIFPFCRDLKYVVVFPDYQGKHHTFLIKQQLPSSVYVSTDQLDDLKRFDKVYIYSHRLHWLSIFVVVVVYKRFTDTIFDYELQDQLFHWLGLCWHRKTDRKIRTIPYSFVWWYRIFANRFTANTFPVSWTGQQKVNFYIEDVANGMLMVHLLSVLSRSISAIHSFSSKRTTIWPQWMIRSRFGWYARTCDIAANGHKWNLM